MGERTVKTNKNLQVELDDCGRAHISVLKPSKARLKVRVDTGTEKYDYDIVSSIVVPLQGGNGVYTFSLYRHVMGIKYKEDGFIVHTLQISNPRAPYLFSNQYVNYDHITLPHFSSKDEIFKYMHALKYDYGYAEKVHGHVLPSIARVVTTKMGICQDFAAMAVALFRQMLIPARLIIGKADKHYHAWCEYWENGIWIIYDPTAAITSMTIKTYKPERCY